MPNIIDAARRRRIRRDLVRHMRTDRVSAAQIEQFITDHPDEFERVKVSEASVKRFLDMDAGKVGDVRVATIERYLEIRSRIAPQPPPNAKPGSLFAAARAFFGMRDQKVTQFLDKVVGTWTFYALSEDDPTNVCRGAIEFSADNTGEFCAQELQKAIPEGATDAIYERYSGYFVFRRDSMVIMLHEEPSSIPKFYILAIPGYDNEKGRKVTMTGDLLKVGAHQDVFATRVHFVRNDSAFDECDVVPASSISDAIKRRIE